MRRALGSRLAAPIIVGFALAALVAATPGSPAEALQPAQASHAVAGHASPADAPAPATTISGTVASALGGPLGGVTVAIFPWQSGSASFSTSPETTTTTDGTGAFDFGTLDGNTSYALEFSRFGFSTTWLGGGANEPTTITPASSITTNINGAATVPPVTLAQLVPYAGFGTHAIENLPYCLSNVLPANDDGYTSLVPLPFTVDYYGGSYDGLYVNNNGNVTFGNADGHFTPYNLTTPDQLPRFAPFFADVDTRGSGSWQVTYGASPDGKSFCVDWVQVGYFGSHVDKLNSFQLVLSSATGQPDRSNGDVDATYNYDTVQWETGDASGGSGGLGGTAAAVGYTAGTGDPGTYFQLAGSLVSGSFLDGGPFALVSHSYGSAVSGRYIFPIRNAEAQAQLGAITGSVRDGSAAGIVGAVVNACRVSSSGSTTDRCFYTTTDLNGNYLFSGVPAADAPVGTDYQIVVSPPSGTDYFSASITVTAIKATTAVAPVITLTEPLAPPAGTSITGADSSGLAPSGGGIPTVYWAEPLHLRTVGPTGLIASYSVTFENCPTPRTGRLTESTSSPGTYTAEIAEFYPCHGAAVVSITFTVPEGSSATAPDPVTFDIYIDPSGQVFDQWGTPVAGASVTLLRADTQNGVYAAVPNGSAIMSPSNRNNPDTTTAQGDFHWDVSPGWYKISVHKGGFTDATAGPWQVYEGHPVTGLAVVLGGGTAPVPKTAPVVSGQPKVGAKLTVSNGVWPAGFVVTGHQWLRSGVPIAKATTASHVVVAADAGHALTVTVKAARPGYRAVAYTAHAGSVKALPKAFPATKPTIVGTLAYGKKVTAKLTKVPAHTHLSYRWLVGGKAPKKSTGASFTIPKSALGKTITVRVTETHAGYRTRTATSAKSAKVAKPFTVSPKPKITGSVKVGHVLKAKNGKWRPSAHVTFSYQWYRDGVAIKKATHASYTIPRTAKGHRLSVSVTAKLHGYAKTTVKSASTGKVK